MLTFFIGLTYRQWIRDQRQPNGRKTGANSFLYVELPRPFYISSWDKCQTFSFTCNLEFHAVPSSLLMPVWFKKAQKPSLFGNGKWEFAAGPRIQSPDGAKTSIKTSFSSTGVGRSCITSQVTLLLKDGQQDFFMSVGSWEMANGRWHIGQ